MFVGIEGRKLLRGQGSCADKACRLRDATLDPSSVELAVMILPHHPFSNRAI